MAQRNSRKGKVKKKQPELRTGGGRSAKAARSQARQAAVARSTDKGPAVRMRPAGAGGMALVLGLGALGVAAVAYAAWAFERWFVVGYPDSLWMFVAFGCVAVAPAVGRLARSVVDADVWGLISLLVPVGLFVAEAIAGPGCPTGGDCQSIGARGALGLAGSLLLLGALAVASWGLARWMYRMAMGSRPTQGRVRYSIATVAMLVLLVFPGALFAAALIGVDVLTRDMPPLAVDALEQVEQECFGLLDAPALVARPAPGGYNPEWTTFAVRRVEESRKGIGKQGLPDDWTNLGYVHPYEATISYNVDGDVVNVTCRRVGPGTGNAVADDLVQPEPDSNPMSPKTIGVEFLPRFFTQGVAGPSEEGKRKAQEAAKAKAAAAAKAKTKAKAKAKAKADDTK